MTVPACRGVVSRSPDRVLRVRDSVPGMSNELVYGASPYGYMTIAPRAALDAVASQVRAALTAGTYGEARAVGAPVDDDDVADGETYDVRELGMVADGDWPPNAAMVALEALPAEVAAVLTREHSMVGQEWLEFSEGDEARVVGAVTNLGYRVERDDELITAFDSLLEL